jgi:cysteine synthase
MSKIGNTPVVEIEPGIHAKLEGVNPSGSHKDRALTALFLNHFVTGTLKPSGLSISIVTSGSAGRSLAEFHKAISKINHDFDVHLNIIIPLAYIDKPGPASIVQMEGVRIYRNGLDEFIFRTRNIKRKKGSINLIFEDSTFQETLSRAGAAAKENNWIVADQHNDASGLHAHASTARELESQVPGLTDVICTTGTGATAAGLTTYLSPDIRVHSRPAMSGTIEGLTDIRHYANYCDSDQLVGYGKGFFLEDDATECQDTLLSNYDIQAGPSSGSCFWLAKKIKEEYPDKKLAIICADGVLRKKTAVLRRNMGTPVSAAGMGGGGTSTAAVLDFRQCIITKLCGSHCYRRWPGWNCDCMATCREACRGQSYRIRYAGPRPKEPWSPRRLEPVSTSEC